MNLAERRKKYGQVFTPPTVAALMADWIMEKNPGAILEPAFGRGALALACLERNPKVEVHGFEIDPFVFNEIPPDIRNISSIEIADFLDVSLSRQFDAIIANPPYIRHRELKDHSEKREKLSRASGLNIPKSANQYVDFLVKATLHLKEGGRSAFLIPAEWMSANFSIGLKSYLLGNHFLRKLITFSNCSNVFDGALTTASLVLLEKGGDSVEQIESFYLQSTDWHRSPTSLDELALVAPPRYISSSKLQKTSKWEPLLKGDAKKVPEGWVTLGELAYTRRGIATGANEFFLLSQKACEEHKIDPKHLVACVGRSNDVPGLVFSSEDFQHLKEEQSRIWLLNFSHQLSPSESAYVALGEAQGLDKRFLTKSRKPWYSMEQRSPAPIWAGVFGRGDLRFIFNAFRARTLTNFHCIYPYVDDENFAKALVVLLNSRPVRDLMVSHQRGYGGGLMKFEPKDLLSIPIPDLRALPKAETEKLANELQEMHVRQSNGGDPETNEVNEIIAKFLPDVSFKLVG